MAITNAGTEFLNGGGEMGRRMRDYDWSRTPLGVPSLWPQALKTLVAVMMADQAQFRFRRDHPPRHDGFLPDG